MGWSSVQVLILDRNLWRSSGLSPGFTQCHGHMVTIPEVYHWVYMIVSCRYVQYHSMITMIMRYNMIYSGWWFGFFLNMFHIIIGNHNPNILKPPTRNCFECINHPQVYRFISPKKGWPTWAQGLAFLYRGGVQVPKRCKEGEMGEMDGSGWWNWR